MRILLVAALLLLTQPLYAQKLRDYSGTWRYDPSKVETKIEFVKDPPKDAPVLPAPPPPPQNVTLELIRQSGDVLEISGGEVGANTVFRIDPSGKQVSDPLGDMPGIVRVSVSHWDGGKLVTEWWMKKNGQILVHGFDNRNINSDGQQVVNRVADSAQFHIVTRLFLEKAD